MDETRSKQGQNCDVKHFIYYLTTYTLLLNSWKNLNTRKSRRVADKQPHNGITLERD